MSSGAIHQRFACMGCTARSNGRGEPSFFNDYKSAAVHYVHSSFCNKSMRWIKAVTVQLNTRPQHVGDGEAGGSGAAGSWRPHVTRAIPPPRRCHDIGEHIMKSVISHGCDIRSY